MDVRVCGQPRRPTASVQWRQVRVRSRVHRVLPCLPEAYVAMPRRRLVRRVFVFFRRSGGAGPVQRA